MLLTVGMIGVLTVLFFTGESWLGGGWYYIPDRAITIALVFCIFWQIALITGTFFLSMRVNKIFCGWRKRIVMIPMFAAAAFLFLFLAWNWLLYSFQFEEQQEAVLKYGDPDNYYND